MNSYVKKILILSMQRFLTFFFILLALFQVSHAENDIVTGVATGIIADVCEQNETCNDLMGIAAVIIVVFFIATFITGCWQLSDIDYADVATNMVSGWLGYTASRALRKHS